MDIVERLRAVAKIYNCQASFEAANEIERLRELVHYAFCEGQITQVRFEDWINSRSYLTLQQKDSE